jgi:membrane protein required for colicin V production
MPFQLLDLILVGIMLVSGLLAVMRGFTREVLSLFAWIAALIGGYLATLSPQLLDLAKQYVEQEIVAKIAIGGIVFLVILIILSLISVRIADFVVDSAAGTFDRTLGFIYGLARGLVLVTIAYLFYGWATACDRQESWVRNAQSLPYINATGNLVLSAVAMISPDAAETARKAAIECDTGGPSSKLPTTGEPAPQPGEEGYKSDDINGLDQLNQGLQPQQGGEQPQQQQQQPEFGGQTNPN